MLYTCKLYVDGRAQTVSIEAGDEREAAAAARQRAGGERVLVVRVTPAAKEASFTLFRLGGRVGPRDLELFCRRARVLVGAGVTVLEAVEILAEQSEKRSLRGALRAVAGDVRAGLSLAEAFRARTGVFPPVFSHTIAAAEETGALEELLGRLGDHFSREAAFKEKVRQALAYPSLVAVFAFVVTMGLFTFVVPKFAALLTSAGAQLPPVTRFVLGVSRHAKEIMLTVLCIFVLGILLFRVLWHKEEIRSNLESFLARIPVMGKILSRAAAARVCRTLALMARTGVPMVRALETVEKVASFSSFRREIRKAGELVREGHYLAEGLTGSKFLPLTGQKMIAVGESSGDLSTLLEQAASLFETEIDMLMQKLPPLVEAAMIIAVGGGVGFVLISLLLPILSVYHTVQ